MDRQFKRTRKGAVQLTSLLDLLFVMIFVSLLQQKEVTKTPPPVAKAKPKVTKPKPKPVEKTVYSISAIFNFYSVSGQQYTGKYLMEGLYNKKSGRINLGSVKWIDKPKLDIGMVPLYGKVSDEKDSFTGRVEFSGCKAFNLKRVSIEKGSPIAGNWKGTYTCAQGSTGLTLTIK